MNKIKLFLRSVVILLLLGMVLPSFLNYTMGQEGPQRVYMYLDYFKTDDDKYLQAELKYRAEGGFQQLEGVEVTFTMSADTNSVDLGKRTTTADGFAKLDLSGLDILADTQGVTLFKASFAGNESFKSASKDVEMGDLQLIMETEEIDSTYQIRISASKVIAGEQVEVEDLDVQILTKRLFGLLPITELSTDAEGQAEFEFPQDIPGDVVGDLWVVAMTEDDDDFGTVRNTQKLAWGTPVSYNGHEKPRELWSHDAPIWIIFTVIAMFAVLWYQYVRVISRLIKIRKL